jgi:hypothetical protein
MTDWFRGFLSIARWGRQIAAIFVMKAQNMGAKGCAEGMFTGCSALWIFHDFRCAPP